jgi:hypothetical protein
MAWQARLDGIGTTADKVVAAFSFYDDQAANDPKTGAPPIVWAEAFSFDPTWSAVDMQKTVQARGAQVRAAKIRADALNAQFPASSTVIAIP